MDKSDHTASQNNTKKYMGIVYILCAAFFFALMNLFVKLGGDLPVYQKCFFRNFVAAFIALFLVIKDKVKFEVPKGNWKYMVIRCIGGTIGILCNFYAIGHLNIADASMLNKLSPFFAILFSIWILKEKPNRVEWTAVLIAFIGALFVIKPSFDLDSFPAIMGFFGGMFAGLAYTCVRKMGQGNVQGSIIVLCFSLFSCISVIPMVIATYAPMHVSQLIFLLLAGASAAGGQFSITAAYSKAPAKEISVYDYVQVIFAAILSMIVLHDLPDMYSFIGYAIIIGIAVWKWYYTTKKADA